MELIIYQKERKTLLSLLRKLLRLMDESSLKVMKLVIRSMTASPQLACVIVHSIKHYYSSRY